MSAHVHSFPASLRMFLRGLVGFYILFIVWQSLMPAGMGESIPHLDKVFHMGAYAVMAIGLGFAWSSLPKKYILMGCVILGLLLEVTQGRMTLGRTASIWDALANSLGAVMGLGFVIFCRKNWIK